MSILYAHYGADISLSFKLEFACSNNGVVYEALIIGRSLPFRWKFTSYVCKEIPGLFSSESTENRRSKKFFLCFIELLSRS